MSPLGTEILENVRIFNVQELSELLKIHPQTVYRNLHLEIIQGVKIGKRWQVSEQNLVDYLNCKDRSER